MQEELTTEEWIAAQPEFLPEIQIELIGDCWYVFLVNTATGKLLVLSSNFKNYTLALQHAKQIQSNYTLITVPIYQFRREKFQQEL